MQTIAVMLHLFFLAVFSVLDVRKIMNPRVTVPVWMRNYRIFDGFTYAHMVVFFAAASLLCVNVKDNPVFAYLTHNIGLGEVRLGLANSIGLGVYATAFIYAVGHVIYTALKTAYNVVASANKYLRH